MDDRDKSVLLVLTIAVIAVGIVLITYYCDVDEHQPTYLERYHNGQQD